MADITVTAANVRPLNGAIVRRFNAGGALNAGDIVYVATDGDVEAADADAVGSAQARGVVIADDHGNTAFAAGARVDVVVFGPVVWGTDLTEGAVVYVSVTAGKGDHTAPATAGDFPFVVGWAGIDQSVNYLFVNPQVIVPTENPT